eukprot:m.28192 g.28192  ORF g.28192 m.28192 type:complete len:157 (-) comp7980_c0_seq2:85-555(-)
MSHFDEQSGVVECPTPWGFWYQTIEEVVVIINVPEGTSAKNLKINIASKKLSAKLPGSDIDIEGMLSGVVLEEDSMWTLEDKKLVRITMVKAQREAGNTWKSLLEGQYMANVAQFDDMEKKMTLERFARENPGFDFSSADISGNYHDGGPAMPQVN